MSGDPMNAAIALGIRVAEKSILGKRVMTFSATPSWVNLTGQDTFVNMVDIVSRADWGMNTNFERALKMILDAIVTQKLTPDDVEDMVLAIFSDMQMDQADSKSKSLMDSIENMYAEAGVRLWGKPFKAPHILFWNLRSTSGFPTLSTQKNASMMSGFSPALLNLFCEEGLNALQSCTPWSLFIKSLDNERYNPLDKYLREHL
jgi:ABC-type amino acid transport substrate-binding protein